MSERAKTQSPTKKRYFSRRQKLVLLGACAINLCLYAAVLLLFQTGESPRSTPNLKAGESLELQVAYERALALALSWQPDVQLSGATTSWQLAAGDSLTLQRPAWSFSFYSPTVRQIQTVFVDQEGVQAGRRQAVSTAPQRVAPDWSLDSDELLLTFLSYGGRDFMGVHPSANVHLQLKGDETGRSIWYITAVDAAVRQSLMVGVDARSREVVLDEVDRGG